nr:MAG TPA: hypothetical protein [Bacteriophage sp.]
MRDMTTIFMLRFLQLKVLSLNLLQNMHVYT